jgi:hypothetical protein
MPTYICDACGDISNPIKDDPCKLTFSEPCPRLPTICPFGKEVPVNGRIFRKPNWRQP